ncbi:hypothetical protein EAI_07584 [Harpegnathos saltator]|uniref:Uncharacterized protein n=1 Tax=Harpegnathos saltator TaxID=610380 RepID=E2BVU9_HARSA|nr:hypothetical protein EAI_07584 [Harpegnathos saltator]
MSETSTNVNNISAYFNSLGATYYQPQRNVHPQTQHTPSQTLTPQSLVPQHQQFPQIHQQAIAATIDATHWHGYPHGTLHMNHQQPATPGSHQYVDHTELFAWTHHHYTHLPYPPPPQSYSQFQQYPQSQHQSQMQQLQVTEWANNVSNVNSGQNSRQVTGGSSSEISHPSTPSTPYSHNSISNGFNQAPHSANSLPFAAGISSPNTSQDLTVPSTMASHLSAPSSIATARDPNIPPSNVASRDLHIPTTSATTPATSSSTPREHNTPSTSSSHNVNLQYVSNNMNQQPVSRDIYSVNARGPSRSPFGWMRRPSYQNQPKPDNPQALVINLNFPPYPKESPNRSHDILNQHAARKSWSSLRKSELEDQGCSELQVASLALKRGVSCALIEESNRLPSYLTRSAI